MMKKFNFIDLFAGCGGLSLGLEESNFKSILYNEINESAAETYKINRADEIEYIPDVNDIDNLQRFKNVDLICGGPPCQGFSGIGHRRTYKADKKDMPRNLLFNKMVSIISEVEPKIFLFENVRGLLSSKWSKDGNKGDVFKDILKSFYKELNHNYHIRWDLLKSSDYGVPQNRPRVFIVGINKKIKFSKHINNISFTDLHKNGDAVKDNFLPPPNSKDAPHLYDLLSDLIDKNYNKSNFITHKYPSNPKNELQKIFRLKRGSKSSYFKKGDELTDQEYSKHKPRTVQKFTQMLKNGGEIPPEFKTKKFAQRLLPKYWKKKPTITVTSLPDDYVHFSQPRVPTVREWARMQTFPDWYKFAGKRTTGGLRRAGLPDGSDGQIELPKYTQIGNAVPVELAKRIGQNFKKILKEI